MQFYPSETDTYDQSLVPSHAIFLCLESPLSLPTIRCDFHRFSCASTWWDVANQPLACPTHKQPMHISEDCVLCGVFNGQAIFKGTLGSPVFLLQQ